MTDRSKCIAEIRPMPPPPEDPPGKKRPSLGPIPLAVGVDDEIRACYLAAWRIGFGD